MLRSNFLAVLCVGLLVGCGSNKPAEESPDAGTSLAQTRQELTTITRRLDWKGTDAGCFSCSDGGFTDTTYSCVNGAGWDGGVMGFADPVPDGDELMRFEAQAYGRNISGSNTWNTINVKVLLNDTQIGAYNSDTRASCPTSSGGNRSCNAMKSVFVGDAGVSEYIPGAVNTIKLEPNNSAYCIAYVDLFFTVAKRSLEVDAGTLDVGVLDFGKQRVRTASSAKQVTVKNTGERPMRILSVSPDPSAVFAVTPIPPEAGLLLEPDGGQVFSVTFTPDTVASIDAGTLTITSDHPTRPTETLTLRGIGVEKAIDVNKSSLAFDEQPVGATPPKQETVTVANFGAGALSISSSFSGDGGTSYRVVPATLSVNAGSSEPLTVEFDPLDEGNAPATLTLTTNVAGGAEDGGTAVEEVTVSLSGRGVRPDYAVDAGLRNFGEQRVDTDTETVLVAVNNTGSGILKLKNIAVAGAGFSVSPSSVDVPEGESRNISVTFTPTSPGLIDGGLSFDTNKVGAGSSVTIPLKGYGVQLDYAVDAGLRDFGEQRVEYDSKTVMVEVTNTGSGTLKLTNIAVEGEGFSVSPSSVEVPEDESANIEVTFAPVPEGKVDGNLTFDTNKTGAGASVTIPLKGYGVQPTYAVDAGLRDFGEQRVGGDEGTVLVAVNNTGSGTLKLTNIAVTGAGFSVSPGPVDVTEDGGTNIAVKFAPLSVGRVDGNLTFDTNTLVGDPSVTVPLKGYGVQPSYVVDTALRDFGERRVNTESETVTVAVRNNGSGVLKLTNIAVAGAGFTVSPSSVNVPETETRNITVTFAPTAVGKIDGNLTFDTNKQGTGASVTIPVKGYGVQPSYAVDTALRDFGERRVNTESETVTVAVLNNGSGVLKLTNIAVTGAGFTVSPSSVNVPETETRNITVTFAPTAVGKIDSNLTFDTNKQGTGASVTIPVKGYGVQPSYVVDTALRDFGERRVNTDSELVTVAVRNNGSGVLKLTNIAVTGAGFTVSPSSVDVPETETRNISVTFAPTAVGKIDGNLTFDTNKQGTGASVTIPVKGYGVQPSYVVDTALRDFGRQAINTVSLAQNVVVTNNGSGILKLTSIAAGSGFAVTPGSVDVPERESRTISVTFAPTVEGPFNTNLTFNTNKVGTGSSVTIPLKGIGVKSAAEVSSESIAFGSWRVGITSAAEKVTVSNSGSTTLRITSITIAAPFSVSSSAAFDLSPGGSHELFVTFTPSATGDVTRALTLATSDTLRPTIPITLTGTGVRPVVELPSLISFGDQRVNTEDTRTVTVRNTGSGPITIGSFGVTGHTTFTIISPTTPSFTVNAGSSQDVTVRFRPTVMMEEAVTSTLTLNSVDVDYPKSTVTLSGRGVKPILVLEPTPPLALDFGDQRINTDVTRTVTVRNTGTSAITISSFGVTGTGFTLVSPTSSSFNVAAGGSQAVQVRFRPTTTMADAVTGTLTLNSMDADYLRSEVTLRGRGVKPTLELDPNPPAVLDFGDQRVNTEVTKTVTVRNTGTSAITITSFGLMGHAAFTLVSPTETSFTVPAGSSQAVQVRFRPATTMGSSVTSVLTLATSDPDYPSTQVTVRGRGVKPTLVLDPSPPTALDFGDQRINTENTKTVKVRNTGSGSITITSFGVTGDTAFTIVSPTTPTFTVAAGSFEDVTVKFRPTFVTEASTADFELTTSDTDYPTATVPLSGRGVNPTFGVSTRTLSFGSQPVGTSSTPAQTVTLSKTGNGTVHIESIVVAGPFSVTPSGAVDLTDATSTRPLSVTFSPTVHGAASGSITLRTNDPANAEVVINLSGNGVNWLEISPATATIDFGNVPKGTTAEREVTFTNRGSNSITLQRVSFVSSQFNYNHDGFPAGGVVLGPGNATFTLKVTFTPTAKGSVTGKITLVSTADNSEHELILSGKGTEPRMRITLPEHEGQSTLDFGNVAVNSVKQEAVLVENIGDAPLHLRSATIAPTEAPFTYLGPNTYVIEAGASLPVQVSFSPTANVLSSANLSFVSDAVNTPVDLPLVGNGSSAEIVLSTTRLDFSAQRVNHGTVSLPVIIRNTGRVDLDIKGFSFTNTDFSITPPVTLPVKIAAADSREIFVKFNPTKKGDVKGTLSILSNATEAAPPVALSGVGLDGFSTTTPADVAFDPVEVGFSDTKTVTVTNEGEYTLTLTSATMADTSGPFIISGFRNGLALAPTKSHEFFVKFTPKVRGYQNGTVVIQSDSQLNPIHNLSVSGTGVGAEVELPRPSINFGRSNVGVTTTQEMTIKNSGERTLQVWGISFADKMSLDGGTTGLDDMSLDFDVIQTTGADGGTPVFPLVMEPGIIKSVQLKFTPSAVGLREARGVIYSNAKTVEAEVRGEGTSPNLSVTPISLRFDGVVIGTYSAPATITITNEGTGPITLRTISLGGAGVGSFTLTHPTLPITLSPRGSALVSVTFQPTEAQPTSSAQLIVEPASSSAPSILVPLLGVGVRQPISVESELIFGQQLLANTSRPRTLHISNNTDTDITLSNVVVEGTGASQFRPESLPLPITLKRGTPQTLNVTFTPQSEDELNCKLKLTFAELPVPSEVSLQGKGIPKVLSVSPSPLDFGGVRIGGARREQPLTIMNLSSDTITLARPEATYKTGEPFLLDGDSLNNLPLEPGVPIIVTVGYQPAVETLSETTLAFGTISPAKPRAVDVYLKGRATRRILSVDQSSLDFGWVNVNKAVDTKEITITNRSAQLQRVVVMLKNGEEASFSLGLSGLTNGIPPDGSATFTVTFDPEKGGDVENEVQVWLQGDSEAEVLIPVKGIGRAVTGSGSGCACGTTEVGSAGMLMLLALVGLGSRRRRRE